MFRFLRALSVLLFTAVALAEPPTGKRVVILKVDGLPEQLLREYVEAIDPGTHKSKLPWIDHTFRQGGAWADNFYVRGISLSVPSWSMLDTGYHTVIHGNAEYDRYTLRVYDYMNFFPFYVDYARSRRSDMPGVEVLDDIGIPLVSDRFLAGEKFQAFQLFQRGVRWRTLQESLINRLKRSPSQFIYEWQSGFELSNSVFDQVERELIDKLNDPNERYLDIFFGDWDHLSHLVNDPASLYAVLKKLDQLVGRIWTAIQASAEANNTVLILVSDHGMNTSPTVYSQGYNLIDILNSKAGGGHHVITNRHPLTEFKLRGLDPFVSEVTSASSQSAYLADEQGRYPTALLDLDGNERANLYLRNNRLNEIQILLKALGARPMPEQLRGILCKALTELLAEVHAAWSPDFAQLGSELDAVRVDLANRRAELSGAPKKLKSKDSAEAQAARRNMAHLDSLESSYTSYSSYLRDTAALLALQPDAAHVAALRPDLVPKRVIGPANSVYDLQNYAVGFRPNNVLQQAGSDIDWDRSFQRVNYFQLLTGLRVRNTPQREVGVRPVDFVAMKLDRDAIVAALPADLDLRPAFLDPVVIWLYSSASDQALIFRANNGTENWLRYLPVENLVQARDGKFSITLQQWRSGLPLHLLEDPKLVVTGSVTEWLNAWHTETEWFSATHATSYSNAIIGLTEQLELHLPQHPGLTGDAALLDRFQHRLRQSVQSDVLIVASDHWNFNVRGFNPGGNHGSFLQISTHSVLLFAGAGIPQGVHISQPYDSLNFAPTVLGLANKCGSTPFPAPPISEIVPAQSCSVMSPP